MADEQGTQTAKKQVAYVPFKTFQSAIEGLEQHGLPNQIDRTLWPSFSGVIQSQLLSAFRFFGLISADGKPSQELALLVNDKVNRKSNMRELLKKAYPELISIDLTKATVGQFDQAMRKYELSAETTRKASSFFLQAAKYAELPMSKHILQTTRTVSRRRKVTRRPDAENGGAVAASVTPPHQTQSTPVRTVTLENGETLSISTSKDTFGLTRSDRQFVAKLLDMLDEYEEQQGEEAEEGEDEYKD